MRLLLVEAARLRNAGKRGVGTGIIVTFYPALQKNLSCGEDVLALNRILDALAEMNLRQATMMESRFFGGLDTPETVASLDVSEGTVHRDWRAAKAWLTRELRHLS
jgi:DNA-directed RNA polymerase specialized sigma24 family protein